MVNFSWSVLCIDVHFSTCMQMFFKLPARSMSTLPVIKTPVYLRNMEKRFANRLKRKQEESQEQRVKTQELRRQPLMIECKNQSLNHYLKQTYAKFDTVPLASAGWKKGKSVGDFFTIKNSGENPAFREEDSNWNDMGLNSDIVEEVIAKGYQKPTIIQEQAIPAIRQDLHCLICGETGSGKTLAYVLPIVESVRRLRSLQHARVNKPFAFVITPGRELAIQVASVFLNFPDIRVNLVTGGSFERKLSNVTPEEVDIVIGTVGMLGKFFFNNVYGTGFVKHVVLDEIDTLVDKSFWFRTRKILENFFNTPMQAGINPRVCLVGATIPKTLDEIGDGLLPLSLIERIISPNVHKIMPHVEQRFVRIAKKERAERLLETVKKAVSEDESVLVFSAKSATADWASCFLKENGVRAVNYNAAMLKNIRDDSFRLFRSGAANVLSCTDLGSRGLDTSNVRHVINFDFPTSVTDYIHRLVPFFVVLFVFS
ncbi:unnamed protein product, partial [Notodromas monacha]